MHRRFLGWWWRVWSTSARHSRGEATSVTRVSAGATFDFGAFMSAVDSERRAHELRWYDLADVLWEQSAELNAHPGEHPI